VWITQRRIEWSSFLWHFSFYVCIYKDPSSLCRIFRALVLQKSLNSRVKFFSKCFPSKIRMENNLNSSTGGKMESRGALVVLEGLDRSGKSSQCSRLVSLLEGQGISAELWRFPDRTTNVGQMISAYLSNTSQLDDHTIHLLFSANRWEKRFLHSFFFCYFVFCVKWVCVFFLWLRLNNFRHIFQLFWPLQHIQSRSTLWQLWLWSLWNVMTYYYV